MLLLKRLSPLLFCREPRYLAVYRREVWQRVVPWFHRAAILRATALFEAACSIEQANFDKFASACACYPL